jgi:uncharacterized protein (DUF427 family)/acyl-CoA thioesterase
MTAQVESAWPAQPDYSIDLVPWEGTARVLAGDVVVAETRAALVVREQDHVDRLYVPEGDVRWDLFSPSDSHTICPFKGRADYWTLVGTESEEADVAWAYPTPLPEVAGLDGHVGFYHERLHVLVGQTWPDGSLVESNFPVWGDATDLTRLMDVVPSAEGRYVGPAHGNTPRNVVEGGQLLGQAIVAAGKAVPGQRPTSASIIFSKAASFDDPVDVNVELMRGGRTFSSVEVRTSQNGGLCSTALLLLDAGADDAMRDAIAMPEVAGPDEAVPYPDFAMTGRELRIVDGAYSPDPDRLGPPVIDVWCRFRDVPADPHLHAAVLAQSTTHWTIAAGMRPHLGFGEADAHVTLSTGIMQTTIAFHDEADITDWLLYDNRAIWSGRGLVQGEGHVFTREGALIASYTVQAMVRAFARAPESMGHDHRTAM